MGLDMYLDKVKRYGGAKPKEVYDIDNYLEYKENSGAAKYSLEEWCGTKEEELDMELVERYRPEYVDRFWAWDTEKQHPHKSICSQIGYWRKANQIHKWFVDNIQDGNDDCGVYEISKSDLKKLLSICEQVRDNSVLVDGKIKNGYRFTEYGEEAIYEDGKYIEDPSVAEELLPTSSGFFFGSYDYDRYYLDDIIETIDILTKALEETDFDKEMVMYSSSW